MVKREVVWTETAVKQRREILRYWTARNGTSKYAEKLIVLINKRTKVIQTHPEAFKTTVYPDTRIAAMGHFSILYKITGTQIIVTAFWDNRQDPKSLLNIIKS